MKKRVELEKNELRAQVVYKIVEYLGQEGFGNKIHTDGTYDAINGVELVWKTEEGTYPKRIRRLLYKRGIKLAPKQVSEIGNIAREYSLLKQSFTYDYTDNFNWERGEFGDAGSCFWTDRENAKSVMMDNGFEAFRVYKNEDEGMARCWVKRYGNFIIAFNGYGIETRHLAEMIRVAEGLEQSIQIGLTNNGCCDGLLYINNGEGYAIGNDIDFTSHDFNIYCEETCVHCGEELYEEFVNCDGDLICDNCFSKYYSLCDECEDIVSNDDAYWSISGDLTLCNYCFETYYCTCDFCNDIVRNNETKEASDGKYDVYLCEWCFNNETIECESCQKNVYREVYRETWDGHEFCLECIDDNTKQCENCEEIFSHNNMRGELCVDCAERKENETEDEE